jgi:hypothetical protein
MPGAVIIVLALLAFPVVVGLSTAAIAGLLGHLLYKDGEARNADSELLDLNVCATRNSLPRSIRNDVKFPAVGSPSPMGSSPLSDHPPIRNHLQIASSTPRTAWSRRGSSTPTITCTRT